DLVIDLNIPPVTLFRLLYTTYDKGAPRLCNFDLVILEISTCTCGTDDLHLRRCAICIGDLDGATNARKLNARSVRQLVRLIKFVAFFKVALRERCARR